MNVLLVNGSPRPKGCTYTALCEVQKELEAAGIGTELVQIGRDSVHGCIACGRCFKARRGRCEAFDDIANVILEKMEQSDGLVIGSPVHYASAAGALTAVLDRVFYAGHCFARKPGACIAVARRAGTTAALDQLNKYFLISEMPLVASQYWNMAHGAAPEEVRLDEEGMQVMRVLGRNMAWLMRSIEAGQAAGVPVPEREARKWTNFIRS